MTPVVPAHAGRGDRVLAARAGGRCAGHDVGMTRTSAATATAPVPATLGRRFEAIVFDWDGTAVPDRHSDASRVRRLVEEACALGLDLAVVSGTHVANVDGQLGARPGGPGALWLLLNRGSEAYCVDRDGPRLVHRRTTATAQEDARALTRSTAHPGASGRTRPAGNDRPRAPEPSQDRPDPGARVGRSAEGADRRAAGRGGAPAGGRRHRQPRRRGGDRPRGGGRGGVARREGDQRRQARRDRPDRQVGLRSLDRARAVVARDRAQAGARRRRRARAARRAARQRLQPAGRRDARGDHGLGRHRAGRCAGRRGRAWRRPRRVRDPARGPDRAPAKGRTADRGRRPRPGCW